MSSAKRRLGRNLYYERKQTSEKLYKFYEGIESGENSNGGIINVGTQVPIRRFGGVRGPSTNTFRQATHINHADFRYANSDAYYISLPLFNK